MSLRLAYLSGPVDAVKVHETWSTGGQHDYFGTSYLSQFYQVCSDLNAEAFVITTLSGQYSRCQIGSVLIENRPEPTGWSGVLFHVVSIAWLLRLLPSLIRFRPQILIATAFANYWFLLFPLKWWGIIVLPAVHCTLWPKFAPVRASWRILQKLNSVFYANCVTAMAASADIARQIQKLAGNRNLQISVFLPTYSVSQFSAIRPVDFDAQPFCIMFGGRIETNKGVYDLVKIAQSLVQRSLRRFQIDICGEGPELEALRRKVEGLGLAEFVFCHGFCAKQKFSMMLDKAHVVVVPTTTQFEEGFAMICAESVLAGRPVITSAVCPALEYISEAAVEVPPDDVEAYVQAILDLSTDRELFERKRTACKGLQQQFYDKNNGWGANLMQKLPPNRLEQGWRIVRD